MIGNYDETAAQCFCGLQWWVHVDVAWWANSVVQPQLLVSSWHSICESTVLCQWLCDCAYELTTPRVCVPARCTRSLWNSWWGRGLRNRSRSLDTPRIYFWTFTDRQNIWLFPELLMNKPDAPGCYLEIRCSVNFPILSYAALEGFKFRLADFCTTFNQLGDSSSSVKISSILTTTEALQNRFIPVTNHQ